MSAVGNSVTFPVTNRLKARTKVVQEGRHATRIGMS